MFRSFLIALVLPGAALGQAAPRDARTTSVALLVEAKRLTAAGSAAEACEKYAESYSLDAQLDALLPLAECFEQSGKLARAYAAYQDAVELAKRAGDPRGVAAEAHANQLRPRLSYLTVDVPAADRLPALSVERDGFRLGSSAWGVPVPIDPGTHVIVVKAYGYRDWQTTIDVQGEGSAPYVEVPLLEKLPDATTAAPLVSPPVVPAPGVPSAVPAPPAHSPAAHVLAGRTPSSGLAPTRWAALAAGGAGVVGVGIGFYFLAQTRSTLSERDGICPTSKNCAPGTNAHLAVLTQQAINQQRAEIAFFALGGAALAIGAGLWFLPKSKSGDHAAYLLPIVQPAGGGVVWSGSL
ncbi:MAG: hypothetical protein ABUL60_03280 [Myxococcales bacterium]